MVRTTPELTGPQVGQRVPSRSFVIDAEAVDRYYEGLELPRLAPVTRGPCMLGNNADLSTAAYFADDFGNLWLRQEWEFHAPLRPGASYTAEGVVRDIYARRDRTVVVMETTVRDADGALAVVQRHHQSFLLGEHEAQVTLRAPESKEGARQARRPAGESFDGPPHTITLEMCGAFFHGRRNYHTDREASAELGFADVVVGGKMTMSYVGELLEDRFGDAWQGSGKLLVKFTNIVWPNETVRARAIITGPRADDAGRTQVFAWLEKADGTVAIVAEGSVRAG